MKVNRKEGESKAKKDHKQNECCLTGGAQLVNHRGSCDAGVASMLFSHGGKLMVRFLIFLFHLLWSINAHHVNAHKHPPHIWHGATGQQCHALLDDPTQSSIGPRVLLQPASLFASPLDELWPLTRTLLFSSLHLDKALANYFIYLLFAYFNTYFIGTICSHSSECRGGSLLFGKSGSGQLQSFQTLKTKHNSFAL